MGLIPLALGASEPGWEIQQPMAVVILGGLGASIFLNMIVIPVLYLKFGGAEASIKTEDYPREPDWPRGLDCAGYGAGLHSPPSQT